MRNRSVFTLILGVAALSAFGCGGDPEVVTDPNGNGTGGTAGTGGTSTDGGGGDSSVDVVTPPDGSGGTGGTVSDADACANVNCANTEHCELIDGGPTCVPNDCATLQCQPGEVCVPTDGGAYCQDNTCTDDVACPADQYCDGSKCVDDICTPGDRRCEANNDVLECDPNGGGESVKFTCSSGSPYYTSNCDATADPPACPCEDDWDCPPFTICEVGVCEGTGVQPTCSLPPEPFQNVLPVNEITWGGTQADPQAAGSPFPASTQVVQSPIVANLDDDNGDGRIDERDFPEIIFTSFCNHDFTSNGVLRAIHGGGPGKGGDFFASCGSTYWNEGQAPDSVTCACGDGELDSTSSLAVGDLNNDGVPEIVAVTEGNGSAGPIRIYDNLGHIIATSPNFSHGGANPGPTLANVDNKGFVEIVVGRTLWTLGEDANGDLTFLDSFEGSETYGNNGQGPVPCIANLVDDAQQEIVAGSAVYRLPTPPAGAVSQADCTGAETDADEVAWCSGKLVVVWDGQTVNGNTLVPNAMREGFCAIADVFGADTANPPGPNNPLDGLPEVILIRSGFLNIFNGQDGTLLLSLDLQAGGGGGPPNVDDFDGDGFPEVGTAFGSAYVLTDFQAPATACPAWPDVTDDNTTLLRDPPATACTQDSDCGDVDTFACNESTGACICLHNGWRRPTEDDSSRVTGSSVFDFNGDGAAEVIYNDECFFRVYNGINGDSYFAEHSESRTRIEYPIVADVDNDGNAEIVFATTTESTFCDGDNGNAAIQSLYNAGIEVWGDSSDLWVSARRIWNQHAYHITNVTEDGRIPMFEPESWNAYNGRVYNTYRSNPRSYGVAPDLTVEAIQVSSPDAVCGQLSDQIDIAVRIANIGDLRVGPGVIVAFYGDWPGLSEALLTPGGLPLQAVLQSSLEPGDSTIITVSYEAASNAPGVLPDTVRVVVDDAAQERECNENNNRLEAPVEAGLPLPDLTIELGAINVATCPNPQVPTTIRNIGSAPASDILVRYYAGDPDVGGQVLHEVTRPGPLAAGAEDSFTETLPNFTQNLEILVYGVVDPDNTIEECNDGNNKDAAENKVLCGGVH